MHHAAPGPNPLQLQAISRYAACRNAAIRDERKSNGVQEALSSNLNTRTIMWRQKRCLLRKARLYRAFLLPKRRFFSVPKRRCKIAVFPLWIDLNSRKVNIRYARQIESKNLSAFFYCHQKGENRYATKRMSQTAQGSVRHQDGRQRMVRSILGRHPPLPARQYAENAQLSVRAFRRHKETGQAKGVWTVHQ